METVYTDVVGEQKGHNNECFVAGWGYRQQWSIFSYPTRKKLIRTRHNFDILIFRGFFLKTS